MIQKHPHLDRFKVMCFWGVLFILLLISGCSGKKNGGMPVTIAPTPTLFPWGEVIGQQTPARSGPGDAFEQVGVFSKGDTVSVLESSGAWYRVSSAQFAGAVWVYSGFVQRIDAPPPTTTPILTDAPAPTTAPTLTDAPLPMPTLTSAPLDTPIPIVTVEACVPGRPDWIVYTIQPGDTLFSLARNTGTTVEMVVQVNCLPDASQIYRGQSLYLPTWPPTPIATLPPPPTATPTLRPPGTAKPTPTSTPTIELPDVPVPTPTRDIPTTPQP